MWFLCLVFLVVLVGPVCSVSVNAASGMRMEAYAKMKMQNVEETVVKYFHKFNAAGDGKLTIKEFKKGDEMFARTSPFIYIFSKPAMKRLEKVILKDGFATVEDAKACFGIGKKTQKTKKYSHETDCVIETTSGFVEGYVDSSSGAQIWNGVPFAAPPVGKNRFREPQELESWSDIRPAKEHADKCIQIDMYPDSAETGSEDCLYLDVYSPKMSSSSSNLPVMVWLTGGGYTTGSSYSMGMFDAQNLANSRNVVVVSVNYRLGPMGFFSLDELKEDSQLKSTGNYAMLDQVAALEWIQKNIAKFGGNPSRVTLFGESAGAFSICWHLVSEKSTDLFHAAILQSGTCESPFFFVNAEISTKFGRAYAASIGCEQSGSGLVDCLRNLDVTNFFNNKKKLSYTPPLYPFLPYGNTIDGTVLKATPLERILAGKFNKVPVIVGSNKNDGLMFVQPIAQEVLGLEFPLTVDGSKKLLEHFFPTSVVEKIMEKYKARSMSQKITKLRPNRMAELWVTDYFFTCPDRRLTRALSEQTPTWNYFFSYRNNWPDMKLSGSYHGSEIYFVFGNEFPSFVHKFSKKDRVISDTFQKYWTNLAKYDDPNGATVDKKLFNWPTADSSKLLHVTLPMSLSDDSNEFCDFWDSIEKDSKK